MSAPFGPLFGRVRAHVITGGLQFGLFAAAWAVGSRALWLASMALIALASVFAWAASYRRLRVMDDTPTSNIGSAAQGYVELWGRCQPAEGLPTLARYSQLSCAWYRYRMEELNSEDRKVVESGQSDASFVLADATGHCVVDPEGAEVTTRRKDTWVAGGYRYTEWILALGDPVYVLGEFRTRFYEPSRADMDADVSALLADWKRDKPGLLRRFDANHDGQIDLTEWEAARQAARAEVEKNHGEMQAAPPMNSVGAPGDGRPYLISSLAPRTRAWTFRLWIGVHVVVFVLAIAGLGKGLAA
ncbi:MAG TPA: GIDE domain-containing protein [Burkholderiales bacterium]|nr:GIDE domain-containing protein [Burkholderiales bacterium]